MKSEKLAFKKAAVFICTKCGKSIPGAPENLAEQLKSELKEELKELGLAKDIRVMTSSCLDTCPVGFQAVAIVPMDNRSNAVVKIINPLEERDLLKAEILKLKDQ